MKYLLVCSLLINIHLCGMLSQTNQEKENYLYKIMTLTQHMVEQLDKEKKEHLSFYKQYLPLYKKCMTQILPHDLCKRIDNTLDQLLPKENKIEELFTTTIIRSAPTLHIPTLAISNNGHHYTHNIPLYSTKANTTLLMNINNKYPQATLTENSKIIFSPNSEYCIILNDTASYNTTISFYHIIHKQYVSRAQEAIKCSITISNDSKYILIKEEHPRYHVSTYEVLTINAEGMPEEIPLKNKNNYGLNILHGAKSVIFLPDNKRIIYNYCHDQLEMYNLETQENKVITLIDNYYNYSVWSLENPVLIADNTKLLFKRYSMRYPQYDYALFNLETLENIVPVSIPPQASGETELPILSIPHTNMFTHITNNGYTLNLLDENAQIIVSYNAEKNSPITALAASPTGNSLALGYSDGTLMIWNLSSHSPTDYHKTTIKNDTPITSLRFSQNQLLLVESLTKSSEHTDGAYCIRRIYKYGSCLLLNTCGKKIIDLGNHVVKSSMSYNGKTIVSIHIKPDTINEKSDTTIYPPTFILSQYTFNESASLSTYKEMNYSIP